MTAIHTHARARTRRLAVLWAIVALGVPARAATPPIPPGAIVWWRFDPASFADAPGAPIQAQREVLLATLRAALASGTLGNRTGALLASLLLVGLEAGDTAHTMALLEFDATRPETGTGMDLESMQVIMHLESGARHAEMLRTVRAIGIDAFTTAPADASAPGVQARLALPGGREGVAFRKDDWEEWREVSWCAQAASFTIGIGRGALAAWFAESDPGADPAAPSPWTPLTDAIDAARPPGHTIFECFVDFDALRARFPEAFQAGRTPRMLAALDLQTASLLVFRARIVAAAIPDGRTVPLIALDAAVRERDGSIVNTHLSRDTWPQGRSPALLPVGATSAMVATVDWPAAFELVLKLHGATIPDRQLRKFQTKRDEWLGAHRGQLDALLARFQPVLIIASHDALPAPLPGVGCVIVPAEPPATPGQLAVQMDQILEAFRPGVRTDMNEASPVWSLRVDRAGLVRLPWWTLARGPDGSAVLVGAWAAGPVETARRWLGGEAPP